jgi:hypothetical protein
VVGGICFNVMKKKSFNLVEQCNKLAAEFEATLHPKWAGTWVFRTKDGPLHVTPYNDWVAMQWYCEPSAIPGGEYNEYSGKWNIHKTTPLKRGRYEPNREACFDELVRRLNIVAIRHQKP